MMTVVKKAFSFFLIGLCFIIFVVLLRTFTLEIKQADVLQCKKSDFDFIPADNGVVERFRSALRIQTVAREKHDYNRKELKQLVELIKDGMATICVLHMYRHDYSEEMLFLSYQALPEAYNYSGSTQYLTFHTLCSLAE